MNEQEFIKNFDLVNNWVNSMRPHWAHLKGNVHDDKDFWGQCIHSVKPEVWTAWCQLYGELNQSHPEYFRKHSFIYEDTVVMATRLDKGEAMTKPYNRTGYNKPVFRGSMAIKDIIAEITERPFAIKEEPREKTRKELAYEEWTKAKVIIDSLFEDGM